MQDSANFELPAPKRVFPFGLKIFLMSGAPCSLAALNAPTGAESRRRLGTAGRGEGVLGEACRRTGCTFHPVSVGCDKNYLWYSVGLPLVSLVRVALRWSCWYSLKLIKTLEYGLSCLRRCVPLKAPSELDAVNS
jgi:hypothetical protein